MIPATRPWGCIRSSFVDFVSDFVGELWEKFWLFANSFSIWYDQVVDILDNMITFFSS